MRCIHLKKVKVILDVCIVLHMFRKICKEQ